MLSYQNEGSQERTPSDEEACFPFFYYHRLLTKIIMAPSQPPPAPLPDLNGIWQWKKMQKERISPEQREFYENSPVGQHLKHCEDSCLELKEKLQGSWNAFREAREERDKKETKRLKQQINTDAFMYNFCTLNTLCPNPMRLYVGCWRSAVELLGTKAMWEMLQSRSLPTVCKPEREVLQRCVGRLVSSSVETLQEHNNLNDTTCSIAGASANPIHGQSEEWQ